MAPRNEKTVRPWLAAAGIEAGKQGGVIVLNFPDGSIGRFRTWREIMQFPPVQRAILDAFCAAAGLPAEATAGRLLGSKGGKAGTGASKQRGGADYYRQLVAKRKDRQSLKS